MGDFGVEGMIFNFDDAELSELTHAKSPVRALRHDSSDVFLSSSVSDTEQGLKAQSNMPVAVTGKSKWRARISWKNSQSSNSYKEQEALIDLEASLSDGDYEPDEEQKCLTAKPRKTYLISRRKYKKKLAEKNEVCNTLVENLKSIIPGMKNKTDRGSALELTVTYIQALQRYVGGIKKDEFKEWLINQQYQEELGN